MRIAVVFLSLVWLPFLSCRFVSDQESHSKQVVGNWLVLYADHKLKNSKQREIYGRIQDSIIMQRALKLVSFSGDGAFQQLDAPGARGKWVVSPEGKLYIVNGGDGFNTFEPDITGYQKGILRLTEYVRVDEESIELVWHLKKMTDADLFKPQSNAWRQKPAKSETEPQIRKRLAAMLRYYSAYYKLVQSEVSYFLRDRVILPFNYYQHAMSMKEFDAESGFAGLFFNTAQAQQAYGYLESAMVAISKYPSGKNFVEEYAAVMAMMAKGVTEAK